MEGAPPAPPVHPLIEALEEHRKLREAIIDLDPITAIEAHSKLQAICQIEVGGFQWS